ncbi:GNAT family N-acetyltransferase [Nisaea acidiphila]|uniref:GNAT family N-acetyltransferase n=1 Tax=Nisaea acidiphila TaxID=1862145 RepID=A0A9J7ASD5_9PROT|nr:GNAT family N-acetyltransferase [Nisaea acidiphila]UUX48229.1 GNAT family N-acetyltransferase [Nisaea acidiphila]
MKAAGMPKGIEIRDAVPADAHDIASFHVKVWRETYGDIAPAEAIAVLDESRRLPGWIESLGSPDPRKKTLLAMDGGTIVGLVSYAPPNARIFGRRGEIKHLYVDASQRGRGLGAHLLRLALQQMSELDFEGAGLSVVEQNAAARQFYKSLGGTESGTFEDPGPIWKSSNILVVWPGGESAS